MNEQTWAKTIMAVIAGCEEGEAAQELLTQLIPVIRADGEADLAFEETEEEVDEDPPLPQTEPVKTASKRVAVEVSSDGKTHLASDQVTELRRRRHAEHLSYSQLAAAFGISTSTVANLVTRRTRAELPLVGGEPGFQDEDAAREARIQARRDAAADGLESQSFGGGRRGFSSVAS